MKIFDNFISWPLEKVLKRQETAMQTIKNVRVCNFYWDLYPFSLRLETCQDLTLRTTPIKESENIIYKSPGFGFARFLYFSFSQEAC